MRPAIDELYPELSHDACEEAADNLRRYADLLVRVHERILTDPDGSARFLSLTDSEAPPTMEIESKPSPPGEIHP